MIILVIFLIARNYFQEQIKKRELLLEYQRATQEERDRIAGELHDDLGQGLSSIISWTQEELFNEGGAPSNNKFQRIARTGSELLENLREILWALDTEHDSLAVDLAQVLRG